MNYDMTKKTLSILFAILFFILFNNISFGQTYSSKISDKEIYKFMNWMSRNQKIKPEEPKGEIKFISQEISKWDSALFLPQDIATKYSLKYPTRYLFKEDGIDTIFNIQDQQFMFDQFTSIKDTIWHKQFENSKLWDGKEQERMNLHYYSIPLFSRDKKYVLIIKKYFCGNVCGSIGYYIYQRIDRKTWKGYRILRHGIS